MSSVLPRKRATHKGDAMRVAIKGAARRVIASVGFANAKIADSMDGADTTSIFSTGLESLAPHRLSA